MGGGSPVGNAATAGPGAPDSGFLAIPRWNDLSSAIIGASLDTVSGRLDYDYFNGGVIYQDNARYPEEPIIIPIQCPHSVLIGTNAVMRPHIHWLQRQAAVPNFLLAYKKMNQGDDVGFETDFSNYTLLIPTGSRFTYVAQSALLQITEFPEIDISDLNLSAHVNFVLFRDSANASTLFPDVDPVTGNVTVTYQDEHIKFDSAGSREEFVK